MFLVSGKKTINKIKEYLDTGKISAAEEVKKRKRQTPKDKEERTLKLLQTVHGVGLSEATKFL